MGVSERTATLGSAEICVELISGTYNHFRDRFVDGNVKIEVNFEESFKGHIVKVW